MLKDVMIRCQLDITNLRGQSYDGASNMAGIYTGVQARIMKEQPLAYYTHCGAHRVTLIEQSISNHENLRDIMSMINSFGKLFNNTIKFRNLFNNITNKIRPLCPTRWTVRKEAMSIFIDKYKDIMVALEEFTLINDISNDQKIIAKSYSKMMKKDTTYFMLKIGFSIFNLLDILVKCFMCSTSTLDNVNVSIDICKDEIKDYRLHFDKRKNEIYTEMIDLGIEKSIKKRRSFSIKKYNGTSDEYNPPDVDTYLRLNKKNILYIHNIYKFINKYIYIVLYCIVYIRWIPYIQSQS